MVRIREKIRAVTFLSRRQLDYLDQLGKDALFYRGVRLSRSQILAALADLLIALKVEIRLLDFVKDGFNQALINCINNTKEIKC